MHRMQHKLYNILNKKNQLFDDYRVLWLDAWNFYAESFTRM